MKTRSTQLPFCKPAIGDEEIRAVSDVLRSGWITTGAKTREFESEWADFCTSSHAIAMASATACLHLLLKALKIGHGDEVILPSLTFASDPNIIALCGAKPVFCDVSPDTLIAAPQHFAALITERTKAIIPVHFAGAPADLDGLSEVIRGRKITIIEDAAHAIGTSYKGRAIGSGGNPAFFSFHPIKNITTGEGGMVSLNDDDLARTLRLLRFHGIEKDAWERYGGRTSPGYDISIPGYKYNLTDIQASLGIVQLRKLARFNDRRASIMAKYRTAFAGDSRIKLQQPPAYEHTHSNHLAVVQVEDRETVVGRLRDDFNILTGLHFPPCHELSFFRERFGPVSLPETERVGSHILSLPLFPEMTDDDVQYVIDAMRNVLEV